MAVKASPIGGSASAASGRADKFLLLLLLANLPATAVLEQEFIASIIPCAQPSGPGN